jgi:transposase
VAVELRVASSLLHRWRNKTLEGNIDPLPGKGRLSLEYEDLCQLRIENKRLRMERDMLKKVVAIFSEEK